MEVLGDFGGFNDGIMLIPAILMGIYSNKMFLQNLFSLLPIKKKKKTTGRDMMNEKCNADQASFALTGADTKHLVEESGRVKFKRNSWLLNLCFIKCLCKKKRRRGMLLQAKAIEVFEAQLDILSIVKTRFDLSILLRALLSKEQLFLFKNQHARAFATYHSKHHKPKPVYEHEASIQDLNFVEKPQGTVARAKACKKIKGYRIHTEMDRKLLLGVWELERKAASVTQESVSDSRSQIVPTNDALTIEYENLRSKLGGARSGDLTGNNAVSFDLS